MNFEPKKTDKAAFVALWHNNELLVLQSRKWRSEGTPYLLPGGGCKSDETLEDCVIRELCEECSQILFRTYLEYFGRESTQWSNCHFYEYIIRPDNYGMDEPIVLEDKLFGYEWWNFEEDKLRIQALKSFMMPGLKWYLEQKGLL